MNAAIQQIVVQLPDRIVTNDDLARENPSWDPGQIAARAGVEKRRIAAEDETALDLGLGACQRLLHEQPILSTDLDALIFCTQTADYLLPPNSCVLHKELKLPESVFAFDLNMGCSGFVNGLVLAHSLILSGRCREILLVTADTISKKIHPADRSVRAVFGDGAAAARISAVEDGRGIIDIDCGTAGSYFDRIIIPAGGCRLTQSSDTVRVVKDSSGNSRTAENFFMDGLAVMSFVNSRVPTQIQSLLARNGMQTRDVQLFVFHQASKIVLDSLQNLLGLSPDKVFRNLQEIGNTFSASVPIALHDARCQGLVQTGDLVVLSGFGVGLAWASALVQL